MNPVNFCTRRFSAGPVAVKTTAKAAILLAALWLAACAPVPTATAPPLPTTASGGLTVELGTPLAATAIPPPDTPAPLPTATPPPHVGPITFASGATPTNQAIGPATHFKAGLTKVYAVFEHRGLSPQSVWERRWYYNNAEIYKTADTWVGPAAGSFAYVLSAGGRELPPGAWKLVLAVDGQIAAEGSFTIDPPAVAAANTPAAPAPATPASAAPPAPARLYSLAYTVWDGVHHNVYLADTNGNNRRLLFTRAAGPSWSPDGKLLFFFGEQGVTQQIRDNRLECEFGTISDGVVAVDLPAGGDICQVHSGPWTCVRKQIDIKAPPSDVCEQNGVKVFQNLDWKMGSARWASVAPDGHAVAFDAKPGGAYSIYFRSILDNISFVFEIVGEQGDWSPDSRQLVYRSGRDNKQGLWISNRDNTSHTSLTINGTDSFPAWSPNGRTIAFARQEQGNLDIYTMNTDGSNLRQLTTAAGHDTLPAYTPGGQIVFRSDRTGSWGIWLMNSDGSGQTEIIANAGVGPDWAYSKMDVR
jgi:Tol biopolymer transport system component